MTWLKPSVPEAVTVQVSDLKKSIAEGYFTTKKKRVPCLQYDPFITKLAVVEGLAVRGARIVVPSALRHKVAKLALTGHQAIKKTKDYLSAKV